MTNKKRNTIITIVVVALIIVAGLVYFILNYSGDDNSLSILEKKWITDSLNEIIDVKVYNDVPVYGYNGSGIIFSFLDYFTEKYELKFNKISYYSTDEVEESEITFLILDSNTSLSSNDILLYEDSYVILGSETTDHITLDEITSLGVLESDKDVMVSYFGEDIELVSYEDAEDLILGLSDEEVEYIILPNLNYMDDILKNNLSIVYHVSDLKESYVLRTNDDTVYSIMKKSYADYLENNYSTDYSDNYLDVYFDSTGASDAAKKNYNAKSYSYGYVINMPYENYVSGSFVGTISNYLKEFENIANVEIEVARYDNIDDLKSAMVSGDVDFALTNFNYDSLNMEYVLSSTVTDLEYVVLSKDSLDINSLKGLKNYEPYVVSSSLIASLCKENDITTTNFDTTDDLLRNIDDNSVIVLDKQTLLYYKDSRKLSDYDIVYEGSVANGYKFIINKSNDVFAGLFSYYVSSINYDNFKYLYHTTITIEKDYTTVKLVCFIVALILFLVSTVVIINRKTLPSLFFNKDDILKYVDPMTSLKNRNYLNANIYKWDDNVIFPQSVIILDLNDVREINDQFGRETGDEIIKKVASVLINNQLENTDIVRSGGDEFLIYMIGYDEKEVAEYSKKLVKLMRNIPNSKGIEVGYSMILDEVKTVDDAINEAIIMMMKNKEKSKEKE